MLDRAWGGLIRRSREGRCPETRRADRNGRRPEVENLEGRPLLSAALAPLPNISVPSQEGYQVPLDASASGAASADFTVTSNNPDIQATIAQGPFLTFSISHTPAANQPGDPTITDGLVTFQLFQDLTPKTTALFESFVNSGYYTGKTIHRINDAFSGTASPTNVVIQGGSPNGDGTGNSGLPGTPYGLELNQQLAFTQAGSLAVAHSSAANSNDTQFFWDTGPQTGLNYQYTIFGQQVFGQQTNELLADVATEENTSLNEKSQPISPVTINSATITTSAPYGVIHINTTGASPGETANITVTSIDPTDNTSVSQTFTVTVTANSTPPPSTFAFTPLASPVTQNIISPTPGPSQVDLQVTNNNTKATTAFTTSYQIVSQPKHGTLSDFNASTGTVTYTPDPGYFGTDVFTYEGLLNGSYTDAAGTTQTLTNFAGNVAPVLINIAPQAPVNTGDVRVIGSVLVVAPPPAAKGAPANQVLISEPVTTGNAANQNLVVTINGVVDSNQPLASTIDRIVVYGTKASNSVTVDPSVDPSINVTLEGGHGKSSSSVLQAGAGSTLELGFYGQNQLHGGTGANQLIGAAGHVRFYATKTTTTVFASKPNPGYSDYKSYKDRQNVTLNKPGGTFYKLVNNKLVPVATPPTAKGRVVQSSAQTAATGGPTKTNITGNPGVTG